MDSTSTAVRLNVLSRIAAKELYAGNIEKAYECYGRAGNVLGCAYCLFLKGGIEYSSALLNEIRGLNPAACWLIFLIDMINDSFQESSSYLQVRNFYEPCIDLLLFYKNDYTAEKIFTNIDYLSQYNKEVYKYTARALIDNNKSDRAELFLKKSIEVFYNDPEAHFMLGEIYLENGKIKAAEKEYAVSNDITGRYYPSLKKLKILRSR